MRTTLPEYYDGPTWWPRKREQPDPFDDPWLDDDDDFDDFEEDECDE